MEFGDLSVSAFPAQGACHMAADALASLLGNVAAVQLQKVLHITLHTPLD